jgi:hypothetical protein
VPLHRNCGEICEKITQHAILGAYGIFTEFAHAQLGGIRSSDGHSGGLLLSVDLHRKAVSDSFFLQSCR